MDVKEMVMNAGILGAGGAGFPTHVKINCQAGAVIVNGAECEPLLRVDQQVMELYAAEVVEGLRLVMEQTPRSHRLGSSGCTCCANIIRQATNSRSFTR